jgi:hypothetical protein
MEARILACDDGDSAFERIELHTVSKTGASHARWRFESGSNTSSLAWNQRWSASSLAGFGVRGKPAEISETRLEVLAIDAK